MSDLVFEFLAFRLWPRRRRLEHKGVPVRLGDREFDLLHALIERRGSVVTSEEILKAVWPQQHVENAIVKVRVAQLRRAIAAMVDPQKVIGTVIGHGYVFLPEVTLRRELTSEGERSVSTPVALTRVIGRENEIGDVVVSLQVDRLTTITGPGGIGKTTVAVAAVERLDGRYEDGIFFVDLAPVHDESLIAAEIALSIGAGLHPVDPVLGVLSFVERRTALLVLDTCEHLIGSVRAIVRRLLDGAPGLAILCTSRQPLEFNDEKEIRIEALDVPVENDFSEVDLISFSAAELFMERARAVTSGMSMDAPTSRAVADICRTLDGVPLAIEFAASRVNEFGITGVLERMAGSLASMATGRRIATDRHRTLRETLDWSYSCLGQQEMKAFRALSAFDGNFSLKSAEFALSDTADGFVLLSSLVKKSLVSTVSVVGQTQYRLLDMTREFGREQLEVSGEKEVVSERHALDIVTLLADAQRDFDDGITPVWSAVYGHRHGDLRTALKWSFAAEEFDLAIRLAAAASVLFIPLGLLGEYRFWLSRAIEANRSRKKPDRKADVALFTALGTVVHHAEAYRIDHGAREAFLEAARAAREIDDVDGECRALSALSAVLLVSGDYDAAVNLANDFERIPGAHGSLVEHRTLAHSTHYAGRLKESRAHIDHVLSSPELSSSVRNRGSQHDQKQVTLRSTFANHLWVSGYPEQALALAEECVADAYAAKHIVSLCQVLSTTGVPISLAVAGAARCEPFLQQLMELSSVHTILLWRGWAVAYEATIFPEKARSIAPYGEPAGFYPSGPLAEYLATMGSNLAPEWAITNASRGNAGWCRAEAMRIRCERTAVKLGDRARARAGFLAAMREAERLGTRMWLPRIAINLAQLEAEDGRRPEGIDVLSRTLDKFTEGWKSPDLIAARSLLEALT